MASATLDSPATFQFAFIDSMISAEMQLLESEGRITEVSTPLMFVANNAAGKFFQGTETPVRTGYTVTEAQYDSDGGQTAAAQVSVDYDTEEVGVSLEIAPSINEDRTVTLKILTEISSVNLGDGPPFTYSLNGTTHVGDTDTISRTEIEDIIVAMDGQTLILGGLIEELDQDSESKVPVLGDIPLINFFFKDTYKVKQRSEIVFLVTPRIVMTPGEAQAVKDETMRRLSDHPATTQDKDRLLRLDEDTGILESTVEGPSGDTPFPFNLGDAIRRLLHGGRKGGAVVEIGE
jgi:general secretion pathway protein D